MLASGTSPIAAYPTCAHSPPPYFVCFAMRRIRQKLKGGEAAGAGAAWWLQIGLHWAHCTGGGWRSRAGGAATVLAWPHPNGSARQISPYLPPVSCSCPPHRSPGPGWQEAACHRQRRGPQAQWRVSWEGSRAHCTQRETGGGECPSRIAAALLPQQQLQRTSDGVGKPVGSEFLCSRLPFRSCSSSQARRGRRPSQAVACRLT